jgi:hypothetical protein
MMQGRSVLSSAGAPIQSSQPIRPCARRDAGASNLSYPRRAVCAYGDVPCAAHRIGDADTPVVRRRALLLRKIWPTERMLSAHSSTVPSSLGHFAACRTLWVHGPKAHSANARMAHIRCPCRSILSMIAPQRLNYGRWCGWHRPLSTSPRTRTANSSYSYWLQICLDLVAGLVRCISHYRTLRILSIASSTCAAVIGLVGAVRRIKGSVGSSADSEVAVLSPCLS